MRILIVGGGGREHALAWRLALSGHEILAAPGNPGIARHGRCLPIAPAEIPALVRAASEHEVDLVVVGPEAPLVAGLADELRERGIAVFGPSARGAELEGSKAACKQLFRRHGIRSAAFAVCRTAGDVDRALADLGDRVVVKADGLAAGKGVVVCDRADEARSAALEMIEKGRFGDAGRTVIVERRIEGHELSVMAITDGRRYEVLAQAEDHKAVFDGDRGPNTGGMGTVSPARWATGDLIGRVRTEILDPTMAALAADGIDYRGVLYAGLMIDDTGTPWILEYNCRFGDPEAQPVLARLRGDLGAWLRGAADGSLPEGSLSWDPRIAVCVVMAAAGYPGKPETGDVIEGVNAAEALGDVTVFHAGTAVREGELVTAGGRVLGVTALADDPARARDLAYQATAAIRFRGGHYRTDIGARSAGGDLA